MNFRSIRRGIARVVEEISAGSFGAAYRGSSLETVVGSIAEQRPLFKGADHAFLWKPKLRIPDIYENFTNQRAFGKFLDQCLCCRSEEEILSTILELDRGKIKGLGPAAANLLYFLHPTIVPPFNTSIVKGYNLLTGGKVKLGRWDEYLAMRSGILKLNQEHRAFLSNDLGAIAALLFDIGKGQYVLPERANGADGLARWLDDLAIVRKSAALAAAVPDKEDIGHTELQGWLRDLGLSLKFQVWIASNDRSRSFAGGRLGDKCLDTLPAALLALPEGETIRFIDVLWLDPGSGSVTAAFEVEHTTSIYSGILRLYDLARGGAGAALKGLYVVAPDDREGEVRAQLRRPAFKDISSMELRFLSYGSLRANRESIARFGESVKAVEAIAKNLY